MIGTILTYDNTVDNMYIIERTYYLILSDHKNRTCRYSTTTINYQIHLIAAWIYFSCFIPMLMLQIPQNKMCEYIVKVIDQKHR